MNLVDQLQSFDEQYVSDYGNGNVDRNNKIIKLQEILKRDGNEGLLTIVSERDVLNIGTCKQLVISEAKIDLLMEFTLKQTAKIELLEKTNRVMVQMFKELKAVNEEQDRMNQYQ